MAFDCLIKNGTIVDGLKNRAFMGSIAIKEGKIAAVIKNNGDSSASEKQSHKVIDATGLTVCPGFIDMHSHADWVLPLGDHPAILVPLLEQGITTVIAGNCGYSTAPLADNSPFTELIQAESECLADRPLSFTWNSMDSFMEKLENQGMALNMAILAGHGNLRISLFGNNYSYPGKKALQPMLQIMDKALEEGACGISLGLGYAPGLFSEMPELEQVATCARKHDRILTVHLKAYTLLSGAYPLKLLGNEPHNLKALEEMIGLARRTGVKLQISHLLLVGSKTWPLADRVLETIEAAVAEGIDIAFDSFPYTFGNTTIYVVYPTWFRHNIEKNMQSRASLMRLKLEVAYITRRLGFNLDDIQVIWGGHPEIDPYEGLFFDEIARRMGLSTFEAYLKVSALSRGKTLCLLHKYNGDEDNQEALQKVLTHRLNLFETDTILTSRGLQNPSSFGTFPRIIDIYHKKTGLLTLEEAVAKMTGKSAERFGLTDRGAIKEGNWADLVVFNYDEIADNTTLEELEKPPSGIRHVFINGEETVRDGKAISELLVGQVLRAQ